MVETEVKKLEMRQSVVRQIISLCLRDLRLGERCYAFHHTDDDYVSLTLYCPQPTKVDAKTVSDRFNVLAERYGWVKVNPFVDARKNEIHVTFQKSKSLSLVDRKKMPM